VLTSANPVVVNRLQVQSAQVIVQGTWLPGHPPQLAVERTWKLPLNVPHITVREAPGVSAVGRAIVPLTRVGPNLYEITQGDLPTIPERQAVESLPEAARLAQVRPYVYPATPEVVQQIEALLPAAPLPREGLDSPVPRG
jgi:hypothetical protein